MSNSVILDYGMGNVNSIKNRINQFDSKVIISSNPDIILKADKIIIPGVGHFQKAIENLKKLELIDTLNEAIMVNKIPVLGICLGMQLMTLQSEEGNTSGLGWINASVLKLKVSDSLKYKIPHIGWTQVELKKDSVLFKNVDLGSGFYFVHSYFVDCNDKEDILGVSNYSLDFVSAIQKDNIFGVQFHPEKSHEWGVKLLENFIKL